MKTPKEKLYQLIDLIPDEKNDEVVSYLEAYIDRQQTEINDLIIDLLKKISSKINDFKGIYLYGSRANGKIKKDSDIDLIILFDHELTYDQESTLAAIILETEYKNDVFIDYHPYTSEALQKNPVFYDEVVNKGIYYNGK